MSDSVIDELRQVKDAYAAQFNYDLEAMCADLRERQQRSGRQGVSYPPIYAADSAWAPESTRAPNPPPTIRETPQLSQDAIIDDPIVAEIRGIRDAHAAKFGYDLDAIYKDIREQQLQSGQTYVTYSPRLIGGEPPEQAPAAGPRYLNSSE